MLQPAVIEAACPGLQPMRDRAARLLEQADALPTLPDIPARALELLEDPECALPDVADVIALDPVLSARCLRLANSPTFTARGQVEKIGTAVLRLGARELRSLLLTVSVIEAFETPVARIDLREIWRHAIATGVLARKLARDLGEPEPDRAYLAGLLHSLGEVLLASCFSERFEAALAGVDAAGAQAALEAEFGVGPVPCCARLLQAWRMPAAVVSAVEFQDRPGDAPPGERLAGILDVARCACRAFGIGVHPAFRAEQDWRAALDCELIATAGGGDPDAYIALLECVTESLGEILSALLS